LTQSYTIYTLVDITNSGVTNSKSTNTHGYNQQQNLNTLLQVISLRSQPIEIQVSKLIAQDVVKYGFGKQFSGLHTVWQLDFISEHSNVFSKDTNSVYLLEHDCDGVAFTAKLDETINFKINTFEAFNKDTVNIRFLKV
jgi:hypothetical protein